ncbi:putative c6 zinc finger domain-containing protein [Phaeomoniella chlamydospora]|uniref:Putative c6 zinc finger domain-containing protein n=1 Tax=Phaeomoniella chlamydospora TaxID=158046 RepID=A0A0G2EPR3_PHACM|nr:putative c6 zinc finger domain-containing protein [Phaeomoniella chlamydospora]
MLRQFDKMRSLADENLLSTDGFGDFSIAGEINTILAKCKGLARATKASRPSPLASIPDLHDTIPSRSLADILVRHFFRIQLNKVVHLPSFRKEYEQYWANPKASTLGFLIKLLLIMSIGAAFHEPAEYERELHECVAKWVHAASCWVSTPYDKDRLNLTGLQVHCLLHISRQVNSIGGDVVWISAGSMLRIAILMGLHRDPSHFPKMSAMQGEIRRRLWATVLEFQLQSCLDTGMPPMLPLDDFDTALPANLNDEDLSEAMKMAPESRPLEELTNTSASVILARTTRTRYEISRLINDFQREPNYDEVLRLSRELSAHLREATLLMQGYRSSSNAAPRDDMFSYEFTSFQQQLVLTLIRRFLLALHRPFAHKARMNPRYYYSRKVCTESALEIITPSEVDTSDDKGWSRLLAVGGGLYREVPSHAAITLCLELIIRLEEDAANMTLQRNKAQREPIRQAVNEMIALGKERIINGETNVKGLVFFAMVMTQIDEMEKGDTDHPERAMFEAAKKLAETCYDLLKTSRKSSPKAPLLPPSSSTSTSTSTSSDAVTITKHPSTSTTMNNTSTENNKWNPPSNTTSHMQQNSSISNTEFNDPMLGYDTASMDEELLGGLDLLGQSSWFYNVGWNDSSWV